MNRGGFHRCRLLAVLLVAGFVRGLMPSAGAEEPQWFRLDGLPQASAGVEVDGFTENTRINGVSSTYDSLFVTPTFGLRTSGSIYHPNLLTFNLSGEFGWGWESMTSSDSVSSQTRNENAQVLRYQAELNLFSTKPFNASFFAEQDHTYRDYGTFNTYTVDASRYGGRMNWTDAAFTLNADVGYRNETASGLSDASDVTETYLNFLGINKRNFGETTLTLRADDMENVLNYGSSFETKSWSAGLSDSETFGHRHQISAGTGLSYSQTVYPGQQSDALSTSENVNINHSPKLDSYLMMNFNLSDMNPSTSSRLQGTVGIRHQLFESLTSEFQGHGSHEDDTAAGGHSTYDQYGLGLNENYTKRLQSWGRLTMGAGTVVDHQGQNSPAGTQTWLDEPHQIYQLSSPSYHKEFLAHPQVSGIVSVKSGSYTLPASDYQAFQSGELTEVRLVPSPSFPTASLMTNGSLAVTITYQSESLGSGSYDTFGDSAQFRLDLWNRIGVYGRLNWLDNNAPPEVLTQTFIDLVGGLDYKRKWFSTGAEYENYDSNFTRYQAMRLFQNFDFTLTDASSLGFDCNESFYHYPQNGDQSQYQFTSRYNARLPMSLTWNVEGGGLLQDVSGTEQIQGVARTGIDWVRGKLSLHVGYEFNSQSTTSAGWSEERIRHRFFTTLRRSF